MSSPRRRIVWYAVAVVLIGWAIALTGFQIAKHTRMTSEKVAAYLRGVDLGRLNADGRSRALRELARKMNALSLEERHRARISGDWDKWFAAMTDDEKVRLIEATLPSGFKQMLNSFEALPEAKRRQAIDRAMAQLKKARLEQQGEPFEPGPDGERPGERMEDLSPELQQRVVEIGLKSYYSQSSAQTKAELAPLLEEMQQLMESGMLFRGRRSD
jgi:hypothetical protein